MVDCVTFEVRITNTDFTVYMYIFTCLACISSNFRICFRIIMLLRPKHLSDMLFPCHTFLFRNCFSDVTFKKTVWFLPTLNLLPFSFQKPRKNAPDLPEPLLRRGPPVGALAVGALGPGDPRRLQPLVGHLALEFDLLVVAERTEAAHLYDALEN